ALAQALGWEQHPLSDPEKAEVIALIQSHAGQLGAMLGEVREVAITESLGAPQRIEAADVYMPELIRSAASAAGLAADRLSTSIGRRGSACGSCRSSSPPSTVRWPSIPVPAVA